MKTRVWQRVEEIFDRAMRVLPEERKDFLETACAGEPTLLREVESLVDAHQMADAFLEQDLREAVGMAADMETRIGPYDVARELGKGATSTVYLARRDDGEFNRQVAIKVLKRGMDTDELLRRFRGERQILASLDHPYIAKLHEGGRTDDGRPYFVMEYVEGTHIHRYCEEHQLSLEARLELFRQVCEAVHYAHQRLVVHRDIKPENILVTAAGVPKLLDFGIAKLLNADIFPVTVIATDVGRQPMTPWYASPEQVRGRPITTTSDVYSLGVLLYLLLTGRLPCDLDELAPEQIGHAVAHQDPLKPSLVVTGGDNSTQHGYRTSRHRLQGDLDNIVLMALRKEPDRRYDSAARMSEDLHRHLAGLPVIAHQGTWSYRAGKFLRRHRLAVTAAAAVLLLVAGFAVTAVVFADRVAVERDQVRVERDKAQQLVQLLVEVFEIHDPDQMQGNTVTAREILDWAAGRVELQLSGQTETEANLLDAIGNIYENLGLFKQAEPLLRKALDLRRQVLGPDHAAVAESLMHLASVQRHQDDHNAAEKLILQALEIRRALMDARDPRIAESLRALGGSRRHQGDLEASEQLLGQALDIFQDRLGGEHPDVATTLNHLALTVQDQGHLVEARRLLRRARDNLRQKLGDQHPETLIIMHNLANNLQMADDLVGAESLFRQVLKIQRHVFGEEHPLIATTLHNLSGILARKGELRQAESLLREVLSYRREILGERHMAVFKTRNLLAGALDRQGNHQEAEDLYRLNLEHIRQTLPAGHPALAFPLFYLGQFLRQRGEAATAESLLLEALELRRRSYPEGHSLIAETRAELDSCRSTLDLSE